MYIFLVCSIFLFAFAWIRFKKKILYPSVIFCFMWGLNCFFHFLIYKGRVNPLTDISEFSYVYMDTYILYFTIATILGFSIAHLLYGKLPIKSYLSNDFMNVVLLKYRWIMWLNFFSGIIRITVLVSIIGFSFSNVIDYRLAADNLMLVGSSSFVGLVFRLSAYINMLAITYVAMSGFKAGTERLKMKNALSLFILFAPVQMATGGRLFILYFIIFYFGSFFLGRGISMHKTSKKWLLSEERRSIFSMLLIMLPLVVVISIARGGEGIYGIFKYEGSFLDSFTYICDGTMVTDNCMDYFSGGSKLQKTNGYSTFVGLSEPALDFRSYKNTTVFASSVYTVIYYLFLDFGYWGSLMAWGILAFLIEVIASKCMNKMNLIRFMIYAMLLKMCYESVITNPFSGNIPFFELIILFALFYKPIFGKFEHVYS